METFLNGYLPDLEMHIVNKLLQDKGMPIIEDGYFKYDRFISNGDADVRSLDVISNTFAPMSLDKVKSIKLSDADTKKKQLLNAGFEVNGILFDSDINAEIRYTQLALQFSSDPTYSTPWKAANNEWVTMDAILIGQVQAAFKAHLDSVYGWLAGKQQEINDAETIDALNAIDI